MTIALTVWSFGIAVVIGLIVCFARISRLPVVSQVATFYYYALPDVGIRLSAFQAGVAGLSMNFGAYLAELLRAGIQPVDFGQREAARSLGLTAPLSLRHIILPQAIRVIFPALGELRPRARQRSPRSWPC